VSGADDLSGRWTGIFNYPRDLPPTGFAATVLDAGGRLSGEVAEPRYDGRGTLQALIDGRRDGSRVRFAKSYDGADGDYDTVRYDGTVDAEGREIAGRWDIPGAWSGTFIMVRDVENTEAEQAEITTGHYSGR
jgi:hypothetical protein